VQRSAAERANAGPDGGVSKADAGSAAEAVGGAVGDEAGGFVEEAVVDLALEPCGKVDVGAVD
jgi:hypothetical protein